MRVEVFSSTGKPAAKECDELLQQFALVVDESLVTLARREHPQSERFGLANVGAANNIVVADLNVIRDDSSARQLDLGEIPNQFALSARSVRFSQRQLTPFRLTVCVPDQFDFGDPKVIGGDVGEFHPLLIRDIELIGGGVQLNLGGVVLFEFNSVADSFDPFVATRFAKQEAIDLGVHDGELRLEVLFRKL